MGIETKEENWNDLWLQIIYFENKILNTIVFIAKLKKLDIKW